MAKNLNMYRLEEATGRDVRQIIHDAVREHGSVALAAASLGMTRQCLYNWIDLLDGHTDTRTQIYTDVVFDGWTPAETAQAVPA